MDIAMRGAHMGANENRGIRSESARAALNWARNQPSFANRVITESYLRLELQAQLGNVLQFKVLENEGDASPGEKRLNVADDFVVTHIGFYNLPTVSKSDSGASVMPLTYVNAPVYTGADDRVFLQALYNGYMSIRKNSTVFFDAIQMTNFLWAGTAQFGYVLGTGGLGSGAWQSEAGYKKVTPYMIFGGKAKNDISITIPNEGLTYSLVNLQCRIAVCFRGFLVQGASGQ